MILSRDGAEYVHIPVTGAPFDAAPADVSFDGGFSWFTAVWNSDVTSVSLLVAGPDAILTAPADVTLSLGRHPVSVRLIDLPETIVRSTGGIVEVK